MNKVSKYLLIVGIFFVVTILFLLRNTFKGNELPPTPSVSVTATPQPSESVKNNKTIKLDNGLEITDLTDGYGQEARAGNAVKVNYAGTLTDGAKFDSSYDRGEPLSFILGAGQVIQGWDIGLLGMKVGGKRRLVIPPELGYGSRDHGPIPANATLIFEVELLAVQEVKK